MDDFGTRFGILMGQLTGDYRAAYAWLASLPHIATLVLLYLAFRHGNRFRRAFAVCFAVVYAWLVVFVGFWFSFQLYRRMGFPAVAAYGGTTILLLVILSQWLLEIRRPRLDLDLRGAKGWRLLVSLPFFVWGFWYPPYEWGVRLVFDPKELLFGAYGLMGCPTTLVLLTVLFLKYPAGNRPLYYALTAYAVIVGAAMTALRYVPDIPFFAFGLVCLASIVADRFAERSRSGPAGKTGVKAGR